MLLSFWIFTLPCSPATAKFLSPQQRQVLLGRLCGDQWSDFNSHDPGITILEQLCFALTELGFGE